MAAPAALLESAFRAYGEGDLVLTARLCDQWLERDVETPLGWLLRGVVHPAEERVVRLALIEHAARLDPTEAQVWYNLGVVQADLGDQDAALESYRRAVGLDPCLADALSNGAELSRRADTFEEALDWSTRRLSLPNPRWTDHANRAIALWRLKRQSEADEAFRAALAEAPDAAILHWERFPLLLAQRRFAEAWDAYERRFECGHLNGVFCYPFPQPLWRGEPLKDRHILVHNEQGLGDQLMFACALRELVERSGKVTLVAAPTLVDLFQASFPEARVLPARFGAFAGDHPVPEWITDLGGVDYQVPIGSLMTVLRRTEESFDPRPYLRPSEPARAAWVNFDAGPGLKVGLCWASNPALFRKDSATRAVKKSMPLEVMAPLCRLPGVRTVSVLNWPLNAAPPGLMDVSAHLTSMDQTAALIEHLDVIVTVDTSVAHLAGAMGKETWLLLHEFADSRWELEAERSYWYADVRIVRQRTPGDWTDVIARVREALTARARGRDVGP